MRIELLTRYMHLNKLMFYVLAGFDGRFPAASLPTLVGEDKAGVVDTPVDICYNIDMEYQRDEHRVHLILYRIRRHVDSQKGEIDVQELHVSALPKQESEKTP